MKRASVDPRTPSTSPARRSSAGTYTMAALACGALLLSSCGGDDDDTSSTTPTSTPSSVTIAPTITAPATSTTSTTTTTTTLAPLALVTEGASVVVANASGVNGGAGRMTDALGAVGFATGDATNSSEGQLATSKVYYDPDNENAKAVADSVREALGGGDIQVLELTVPAPTDTGEIGDASVVVAMGNDIADKSLDELQGRVPAADEESSDEATSDSTDEATSESSVEASSDG